jgi:hypothetical protein
MPHLLEALERNGGSHQALLMAVFTNPLKVIDSLLQEFSSIV